MKKMLATTLALAVFLVAGASVAFATHKPDHEGPHCAKSGNATAGNSGQVCSYPPGQAKQTSSGKKASFVTEAPKGGGITVGMASLAAIGALGTLLVVRRRWMFRTAR